MLLLLLSRHTGAMMPKPSSLDASRTMLCLVTGPFCESKGCAEEKTSSQSAMSRPVTLSTRTALVDELLPEAEEDEDAELMLLMAVVVICGEEGKKMGDDSRCGSPAMPLHTWRTLVHDALLLLFRLDLLPLVVVSMLQHMLPVSDSSVPLQVLLTRSPPRTTGSWSRDADRNLRTLDAEALPILKRFAHFSRMPVDALPQCDTVSGSSVRGLRSEGDVGGVTISPINTFFRAILWGRIICVSPYCISSRSVA